ncbi:hypothetical protein ACKFR5_03060 [Corynebacterium marquesiae]|uniref:hypothetical protein n=1 Tax=Corynebacterium marquesiae TaxID=2913503 RepID=UPI0038D1E92D
MGLITATVYIDEATPYKMEVQGTTATVEYESEGVAPALITPNFNRSTNEWEVAVTIFESIPLRNQTSLEEQLNELDDVAKAANAFRTALNLAHRPQAH